MKCLGLTSHGKIDELEEKITKQQIEIVKLRSTNLQLRIDLEEHRRRTNKQIGELISDIRSGRISVQNQTGEATIAIN